MTKFGVLRDHLACEHEIALNLGKCFQISSRAWDFWRKKQQSICINVKSTYPLCRRCETVYIWPTTIYWLSVTKQKWLSPRGIPLLYHKGVGAFWQVARTLTLSALLAPGFVAGHRDTGPWHKTNARCISQNYFAFSVLFREIHKMKLVFL